MTFFEDYTRQHETYFTRNCDIKDIDIQDMDGSIKKNFHLLISRKQMYSFSFAQVSTHGIFLTGF